MKSSEMRGIQITVSTTYNHFLVILTLLLAKRVQMSLNSAWSSVLFLRHHLNKFAAQVDIGLSSYFIEVCVWGCLNHFLYLAHQTDNVTVRHLQAKHFSGTKQCQIYYLCKVSLITITLSKFWYVNLLKSKLLVWHTEVQVNSSYKLHSRL